MEQNRRSLFLFFGLASFIALIGAVAYLAHEMISFYSQPDLARLEVLWARDIERLRQVNALHPGFADIKDFEVYAATERAKEWQKSLHVPIQTHSDGKYHLEILLLTWEENDTEAAIIQYNLVDLKTKNMVWELGRTFYLKGNQSSEEHLLRQVSRIFESSNTANAQ